MTNIQMSPRQWILLVTLALIWSFAYMLTKVALGGLPVVTVVAGRIVFAALALIPIVYLTGQRLPGTGAAWLTFLVLSLLNNVLPFTLIASGQLWVDSGLTAILIGTTPLFSVVIASMATDERMTIARVLGVLAGLGGLIVLIGPKALAGLGQEVTGQILIVGGALSYACAASFGRRRLKGTTPMVAATGQLICSSLILVPASALIDRPWTYDPSLEVWGAILAIALICTAVAYMIFFRLLATAGATNILLVTFLVPVGAVIVGVVVLSEPVTLPMLGGLALIFLGLAMIDGRLFGRFARRGAGT